MPISANTLKLLMDAGVEGDDLVRVVASIDADNGPKPRSNNAERQARLRAKRKAESVTNNVTDNATSNVTESVTPPRATHVEELTTTQKIEPQEVKQEPRRNDASEFKAELSSLDTERLDALIKHRRAKKGQITGHAARLFRRDADACGLTLSQAVDTCISRNWITVKPEWLQAQQRAGPGSSKPPTASEILKTRRESFTDDDAPPNRPYLALAR
ncbi:MAG: hypothetical protein JWM16_6326 [Verrucomicrobiales bacterium]|nr:hypothetical protein [Verrucomicrobiales bacterium]